LNFGIGRELTNCGSFEIDGKAGQIAIENQYDGQVEIEGEVGFGVGVGVEVEENKERQERTILEFFP
jgi:hypothetical protein